MLGEYTLQRFLPLEVLFNVRTGIGEAFKVCLCLIILLFLSLIFFWSFSCIAGISGNITLKSKFILLLQPLRGIKTVVFRDLYPILCFTVIMDLY